MDETIGNLSEFCQGIEQILIDVKQKKIALMCVELDPLTCHCTILVCHYPKHPDLKIEPIWPDGSLESHPHLQERVIQAYGLQQIEKIERKAQDQLNSAELRSQLHFYHPLKSKQHLGIGADWRFRRKVIASALPGVIFLSL